MDFTNIKLQLFLLQSVLKRPVAYDKKNNKFYIIEKGKDGVFYYDLTSDGKVYFDLDNKDLIFANSNLAFLSEPAELSNDFPETGHPAELSEPAKTKNKLTALKYNLKDFSNLLDGFHKETAKDIYKLTIEILNNTHKKKVIEKTLMLYEKARKHAENQQPTDLNSLINIKNQLQGTRNKQKAIKKSVEKYKRKKAKRTTFFMFITALTVFFLVFFAIKKTPEPPKNTQTVQTITLTEKSILKAINDYEKQNNVKVYQWRRNKIVDFLQGKQMSGQEFNKLLDSLINKAWK